MQTAPLKSAASLTIMYTVSFLLCVTFGALLIQIGIPGNYINLIMLALLVGGYIFTGMYGKTMQLNIFQTTNRSGTSFYMGQTLAAGLFSSSIYIFLAGDIYQTGTDALTIFSGLVLGIALMTILFSAPINRSNAISLASIETPQKSSKLLRLLILCVVMACSILLLYIQFSAIGTISQLYFGVPSAVGIILAGAAIGFCLIMGGLQSLTMIRMLSYPIIATAFLMPIIWISYKITGNPIPQLSFGVGALEAITDIDQEMINEGFAQEEDIFQITSDGLTYDPFNYFASLLCIAFGTASMPHLLQHFKALPKASQARRTGIWALGFSLIILTAIPAIAAFVKLDIYGTLLGLPLSELEQEAEWLFSLSDENGTGFITLCGELVANSAQAIAACGQGADYFIAISDIGLNTDLLLLTSAALHDLPIWMTTMLATGALFAVWSTADGLVFVVANTLAEDGYHNIIRSKSPMGIRLFTTRIFIALLIALSCYLVFNISLDASFAFAACFALLSASLFPFLIYRFWFTHFSELQIGLGILSGLSLTMSILCLSHYGVDMIVESGDEMRFGIPYLTSEIEPLSTGILGLVTTLVITFVTSKIFKQTSKTREAKSDVTA